MALSKQIEFRPTGFSTPVIVQSAYCKVVKVSGDKKCIEFTVAVFENKDATAPLYSNIYLFEPNLDDNFIKQSYRHLKTLDEFAIAVDC